MPGLEDYCPGQGVDGLNGVSTATRCQRLEDSSRNNDGARLEEIALATTLLQGSERLHLQRLCCEAYCSCNNNDARLKEIGLATKMF